MIKQDRCLRFQTGRGQRCFLITLEISGEERNRILHGLLCFLGQGLSGVFMVKAPAELRHMGPQFLELLSGQSHNIFRKSQLSGFA